MPDADIGADEHPRLPRRLYRQNQIAKRWDQANR